MTDDTRKTWRVVTPPNAFGGVETFEVKAVACWPDKHGSLIFVDTEIEEIDQEDDERELFDYTVAVVAAGLWSRVIRVEGER